MSILYFPVTAKSHLKLLGIKKWRWYGGCTEQKWDKNIYIKVRSDEEKKREENGPVVHCNYSQVVLSVSCAALWASAAGGVKVTGVWLLVWNTDGGRIQPLHSLLGQRWPHSRWLSLFFHACIEKWSQVRRMATCSVCTVAQTRCDTEDKSGMHQKWLQRTSKIKMNTDDVDKVKDITKRIKKRHGSVNAGVLAVEEAKTQNVCSSLFHYTQTHTQS